MKCRVGFVSNSSSSSFIIRKSALTESQLKTVRDYLHSREGWYTTEALEDDKFIHGWVEAHNRTDEDDDTAADVLKDMMKDFGISHKDYQQAYEDYVELKGYNDEA